MNRPSTAPKPDPHGKVASQIELAYFEKIATLAYQHAGLALQGDKAPMILARVGKRMRKIGATSLAEYCDIIDQDSSGHELEELVCSLTTNVTSFLREEYHFIMLKETVLPKIALEAQKGNRIRLWSAGCSTGQEPYSLAMLLHDEIPNISDLDIKILATDLDRHALAFARRGEYQKSLLSSLPDHYKRRYFEDVVQHEKSDSIVTTSNKIRSLISFRKLNLQSTWPMRFKFQIIFCRNVVIYFDRTTQHRLWKRFSCALERNGLLFLGHSERIDTIEFPEFEPVGTTTYRRSASHSPTAEGI